MRFGWLVTALMAALLDRRLVRGISSRARLPSACGMLDIAIRVARPDERSGLEASQWRASLANAGDREALLAHPDAIVLPMEQTAAGGVYVAECADLLAGFAAIARRHDRDAELDMRRPL